MAAHVIDLQVRLLDSSLLRTMLRAEIQIKMKKFSTMGQAAEFIQGLDVTISMRKWLLRECANHAVKDDSCDYVVMELDYRDVFVWRMPADRWNAIGVQSVVNAFKNEDVAITYDSNLEEMVFFFKGSINPVIFIQLGEELSKFLK